MNMTQLLTPAGREMIRSHLERVQPSTKWLVAEHGFVDNSEMLPVSDETALQIAMQVPVMPEQMKKKEAVCQS
jgi:hypothetical protein